MIAFVDTSVLLRKLLGEPHPLREWKLIAVGYASRLLRAELGRTIDRYRLQGKLDDAHVASLHEEAHAVLRSFSSVVVSEQILERASQPMPTVIGTLDAIHLVSAMEVRSQLKKDVIFATHDEQLSIAARAMNFRVIGV